MKRLIKAVKIVWLIVAILFGLFIIFGTIYAIIIGLTHA